MHRQFGLVLCGSIKKSIHRKFEINNKSKKPTLTPYQNALAFQQFPICSLRERI